MEGKRATLTAIPPRVITPDESTIGESRIAASDSASEPSIVSSSGEKPWPPLIPPYFTLGALLRWVSALLTPMGVK